MGCDTMYCRNSGSGYSSSPPFARTTLSLPRSLQRPPLKRQQFGTRRRGEMRHERRMDVAASRLTSDLVPLPEEGAELQTQPLGTGRVRRQRYTAPLALYSYDNPPRRFDWVMAARAAAPLAPGHAFCHLPHKPPQNQMPPCCTSTVSATVQYMHNLLQQERSIVLLSCTPPHFSIPSRLYACVDKWTNTAILVPPGRP